jgi:hypothetical protein
MRTPCRETDLGKRARPAPRPWRSPVARLARGERWRLAAGALGVVLAWGVVHAQESEHVISFDDVAVSEPEGVMSLPEVAHAERLAEELRSRLREAEAEDCAPPEGSAPAPPSRSAGRPSPAAGAGRAPAREEACARRSDIGAPRTGQPSPEGSTPAPRASAGIGQPGPRWFAPREGAANPSFVEDGFLVEAFWSVKTGTPQGRFVRAHFHPPDLSTGFEAQHFGYGHELHGIYLRALDGRPFGLASLRYRISRNRQLPGKAASIDGYSNFNVNVLVAWSFDPTKSVRSQFVAFPVGQPMSNDPTLPFATLPIFGFEYVTELYIASSASVDLDEIRLVRWGPIDEPPDDRAAKDLGSPSPSE